jgi:hypothetical protein
MLGGAVNKTDGVEIQMLGGAVNKTAGVDIRTRAFSDHGRDVAPKTARSRRPKMILRFTSKVGSKSFTTSSITVSLAGPQRGQAT